MGFITSPSLTLSERLGRRAACCVQAVGRAHYGSTIEGPAGEERYPDRYIMQRSLRNMLCLAGAHWCLVGGSYFDTFVPV